VNNDEYNIIIKLIKNEIDLNTLTNIETLCSIRKREVIIKKNR